MSFSFSSGSEISPFSSLTSSYSRTAVSSLSSAITAAFSASSYSAIASTTEALVFFTISSGDIVSCLYKSLSALLIVSVALSPSILPLNCTPFFSRTAAISCAFTAVRRTKNLSGISVYFALPIILLFLCVSLPGTVLPVSSFT